MGKSTLIILWGFCANTHISLSEVVNNYNELKEKITCSNIFWFVVKRLIFNIHREMNHVHISVCYFLKSNHLTKHSLTLSQKLSSSSQGDLITFCATRIRREFTCCSWEPKTKCASNQTETVWHPHETNRSNRAGPIRGTGWISVRVRRTGQLQNQWRNESSDAGPSWERWQK